MGVVLESARFIKARWDLTGEDFRRIWNFCMLLALALVVYVFTTNEEGGGLNGLLHSSAAVAARNARRFRHHVSALAADDVVPVRRGADVQRTRSRSVVGDFIVRPAAPERERRRRNEMWTFRIRISSCVCFPPASITNAGTHSYFWGQAVLIAWALWPLRSRRFGIIAWLGALAVVIGLGFFGQHGIGELQRALEGYNAQWMTSFMRQRTDASQSVTAIGQIGKLKLSPRIVIRLEPKTGSAPPDYLREASYRSYHPQGQTWYAGRLAERFHGHCARAGQRVLPGRCCPAKPTRRSVNIASYLDGRSQDTGDPEGLLPLPTGSSRLENLPVFTLKINKTGAVLAVGSGPGDFRRALRPGRDV